MHRFIPGRTDDNARRSSSPPRPTRVLSQLPSSRPPPSTKLSSRPPVTQRSDPLPGTLPKPTPPPLRERARPTPPPPRFSVASDQECTPLYLRAIAPQEHEPISEARHAIPPPVQPAQPFDNPSVPPFALSVAPPPRKWLVPIVAAAAVAGTFGVLGLLAFILHQGATTGAVAEAIAEQHNEAASHDSPIEDTPRLVQPGFDARAAMDAVRREAQELGASCGARSSQRVSIAVTFQPSGRVSSVNVRGGWGDTSEGRCVERALHYINVTPFAGRKGEVEVSVDIQPASKSIRQKR